MKSQHYNSTVSLITISRVSLVCLTLCSMPLSSAAAPEQASDSQTSEEPLNPNRTKVVPMLDVPLRDTHILRDASGTYYMTGTLSKEDQGDDFDHNAGIRLWKSNDLKKWDDLGLVWDLDKDPQRSPKSAWQESAIGLTSPEILFVKGNYYIAYAADNNGCGLLKSSSGKPEGPYEDLGQITTRGGDPSLFEDKDGSVYFIWGSGYIARMNADLTRIEGETRLLLADLNFDLEGKAQFLSGCDPVRPRGFRVQLYNDKKGDRYLMTFAAENCRFGRSQFETFAVSSDRLFGPFGFPDTALTNGGQSTLFQNEKGEWFGTFYGADAVAEFRNRPAFVPLVYSNTYNQIPTNHRTNVFTERGPWDTIPFCRPELRMNDAMICNAPDGYYYLAGSNWTEEFFTKVYVYRSKDLKTWERIGPVFEFKDIPWVAENLKQFPDYLDSRGNINGVPWNMEIHHLSGKFYMAFQVKGAKDAKYKSLKVQGGMALIVSDRGEGPYRYHATDIQASMPSFMQDDDGTIYFTMNGATKVNPDMTGFAEEKRSPEQKEGLVFSYDPIGSYMIKIGEKYVFCSENLVGGYDGQYWVSDSPYGPWSRPRVHMPHGGHGGMFKGKDGKYYSVMWHAFDAFSPTVAPLHVEVTDDDVIIMPEWERDGETGSED